MIAEVVFGILGYNVLMLLIGCCIPKEKRNDLANFLKKVRPNIPITEMIKAYNKIKNKK